MKKAIITGITGQDGCYLAKLLLDKGYKVYGAQRRNTGKRYWRLDELGIRDDIEIVDIDLNNNDADLNNSPFIIIIPEKEIEDITKYNIGDNIDILVIATRIKYQSDKIQIIGKIN